MKCPKIRQTHFTGYLWKQKQYDNETFFIYRILQIGLTKSFNLLCVDKFITS